jgi:hypothetical protein
VKTISRSAAKRVAELKEQLTECRAFTLGNSFQGKAVDPKWAWVALAVNSHARLVDREDGSYHVNVHDNLWYELRPGERT